MNTKKFTLETCGYCGDRFRRYVHKKKMCSKCIANETKRYAFKVQVPKRYQHILGATTFVSKVSEFQKV